MIRTTATPSALRTQPAAAPGRPHPLCMVWVTAAWGACFVAIQWGLRDAPILWFAALRALVAGVTLLAVGGAQHRPRPSGVRAWALITGWIPVNVATPRGVGGRDGIEIRAGREAGTGAADGATSGVHHLDRQGVSNSEACRMVGVNRRTGTRWRYGRTVTSSSGAELHYQPMTTTTKPALSARFLSEDERIMIGDRAGAGSSLRAIGGELGRSASTISREVHRNRDAESVSVPV